jgi:hypothetical protein
VAGCGSNHVLPPAVYRQARGPGGIMQRLTDGVAGLARRQRALDLHEHRAIRVFLLPRAHEAVDLRV